MYWWLLTSRRWTAPRPINVYVIEHARGLILFDTGQDRASVTDPAYFPGGLTGFLYGRLARFDIGEQDTLTARLATLGYAPSDVDTAILSHLHQDHIGGLPEPTGAELLVSAAEWAELSKPPPGRGAGTIYRQRRRTDEQHFVVTDFEPDQLAAVRTLPPARDLRMRFTFEPHGGGTRLIDDRTPGTVLPRWLARIGASRVSSIVRANLAKLKELLETGRVRLQDGRVETVSS